jgi:hypothetical protein
VAEPEDIQEAIVLSRNLPPRLPGNKVALRYRIKSDDVNQISNWSIVHYIDGPQIDGDCLLPENIVGGQISESVLSNRVATITTTSAHGLSNNDYVNIWNRAGYSGIYQVSNTTATSFTMQINSANIASNLTDGGNVFAVNHTDTTIRNKIEIAANNESTLEWSDKNPINEYDIFIYKGVEIADISGTVQVNSVATTKTIYFPAAALQTISQFNVGDRVEVALVNAALNQTLVTLTAVEKTTAPYFIRYTGTNSSTLVNTTVTTGFIGLSADPLYRKPVDLVPYEYVGTYVATGSGYGKKISLPRYRNQSESVTYDDFRILVQASGSTKTPDPALRIIETQRV